MSKRLSLDELRAMLASNKKVSRGYSEEEHHLQCECVRYFNLRYPHLKGRLFAVPNGGRRDAITGAKLKAEGVVPGVSDLILLKSNRHYGARYQQHNPYQSRNILAAGSYAQESVL